MMDFAISFHSMFFLSNNSLCGAGVKGRAFREIPPDQIIIERYCNHLTIARPLHAYTPMRLPLSLSLALPFSVPLSEQVVRNSQSITSSFSSTLRSSRTSISALPDQLKHAWASSRRARASGYFRFCTSTAATSLDFRPSSSAYSRQSWRGFRNVSQVFLSASRRLLWIACVCWVCNKM